MTDRLRPTRRRESVVPVPRERVWAYFAAPGAMRRLAPPFELMRPVREASSLRDGQAWLAPATSLPGPLGQEFGPKWVARHDPAGYVEGRSFRDVCVSSPYRELTGWVHDHGVEDASAADTAADTASETGACRVSDAVTARVPGPMLRRILDFRHHRLAADLAALGRADAAFPDTGGLTVAVTGASGLVGTALCALLGVAGHRVIRLSRSAEQDGSDTRYWNPDGPAEDLLDGVDVLVHLAGASIAGRFTSEHLARVRGSRVEPTRRLAELVATRSGRTALVCASAIGFFGADRGDEELDERSARGTGPLAEIVADWEAACEPARAAGARVVSVRTGIVLSSAGGVLATLAPLFQMGAGGRLGSGRQWFSWIALDDLLDVYHRAIRDPELHGPVDATAPQPVRNAEFTRVLGRVLRRPTLLPVPALGPRLLLGRSGADELALADQRVLPEVLTAAGHEFRYPELEDALRVEFGRGPLPAVRWSAA